jgi:hypothetical protein
MPVNFRAAATDSMPERIQVTQDLERRFREQEAAKAAAKPISRNSSSDTHTKQGER